MQELSLSLLKKKLKRYPHLNELELFLQKIDKKYLKLVLLFGSLVKGSFTQYSDIDVLCVFNKAFKTMKERFLEAYKFSEGLVQPKTLTFYEFKEGLKEGNSFLHSIIEKGIIIYNTIPKADLNKWIKKGKEKNKMRWVP